MSDDDLARISRACGSIARVPSCASTDVVSPGTSAQRIYGAPVVQAGMIDMFSIMLGGVTGGDGQNVRAVDVSTVPALSSSATIQAGINL